MPTAPRGAGRPAADGGAARADEALCGQASCGGGGGGGDVKPPPFPAAPGLGGTAAPRGPSLLGGCDMSVWRAGWRPPTSWGPVTAPLSAMANTSRPFFGSAADLTETASATGAAERGEPLFQGGGRVGFHPARRGGRGGRQGDGAELACQTSHHFSPGGVWPPKRALLLGCVAIRAGQLGGAKASMQVASPSIAVPRAAKVP